MVGQAVTITFEGMGREYIPKLLTDFIYCFLDSSMEVLDFLYKPAMPWHCLPMSCWTSPVKVPSSTILSFLIPVDNRTGQKYLGSLLTQLDRFKSINGLSHIKYGISMKTYESYILQESK